MTFDEHMCMKGLLLDVREVFQERGRPGPRLAEIITKLDYCLAMLRRPHVLRTLEPRMRTDSFHTNGLRRTTRRAPNRSEEGWRRAARSAV
jgi:hypothetical protein